jgi:hypothetical protein
LTQARGQFSCPTIPYDAGITPFKS